MKDPLNKRLTRELRKEWKKYFVVFFLMTFMIGVASGMYVANGSMLTAIDEAYDKYTVEDGHFELKEKATTELLDSLNDGITVYELFSKTVSEDPRDGQKDESTIKIFRIRKDLNKVCVMEGVLPSGKNEIAVDRMHADNRNIKVGDTIGINGEDYKVTGLIALPDYGCLFDDNSDIMFNAITFDVGVVTDEDYENIDAGECFEYAFRYDKKPADEKEEKEVSDKLAEKIAILCITGAYTSDKKEAEALDEKISKDPSFMLELAPYQDNVNELLDFVPSYANQAIQFAADDFGSDMAMMGVLVYIFIGVLAFVFAITTRNTIESEAAVIGTLRSTGYTRGELIRHYMLIPVTITILSAIVGNVLGYTYFKDVVVDMYYNSYSLLKYETIWNAKAFILTTVIPLIIMFFVNLFVIARLMRLSPLKFLRRDLSTSKRKKAMRIPSWSFMNRFRMRIFLQNLGGYIVLLFGILFVMILLAFSVGLPETLDHYKAQMDETLISKYEYILKDCHDEEGNLITTSVDGAEKFSITNLFTTDGVRVGENVTVYGFSDSSSYIKISEELKDNEVMISSNYADKFGLGNGDKITLKEKYTDSEYDFEIKGVYDYPGGIAIFIGNDAFNGIFGKDEGSYTGFLSDKEIDDIDNDYIYSVITVEDMMSLSIQLDHSMGSYMTYLSVACLVIGVLVIYLLTKQIIDKNATSISMVKVLGYENSEINSLYILLTTIVVVVFSVLSALLSISVLTLLFRVMMYSMAGWFEVYISPSGVVKMVAIMVASYLIVSLFDMIRIRRIPLTEALKNVE